MQRLRDIMISYRMLHAVILLFLMACCGCEKKGAAEDGTTSVSPAKTPAEAVANLCQAVQTGDWDEYKNCYKESQDLDRSYFKLFAARVGYEREYGKRFGWDQRSPWQYLSHDYALDKAKTDYSVSPSRPVHMDRSRAIVTLEGESFMVENTDHGWKLVAARRSLGTMSATTQDGAGELPGPASRASQMSPQQKQALEAAAEIYEEARHRVAGGQHHPKEIQAMLEKDLERLGRRLSDTGPKSRSAR